jgi:hypothetical protein
MTSIVRTETSNRNAYTTKDFIVSLAISSMAEIKATMPHSRKCLFLLTQSTYPCVSSPNMLVWSLPLNKRPTLSRTETALLEALLTQATNATKTKAKKIVNDCNTNGCRNICKADLTPSAYCGSTFWAIVSRATLMATKLTNTKHEAAILKTYKVFLLFLLSQMAAAAHRTKTITPAWNFANLH